jgi:PST family polysaccharide transporter
MSGKSQTFVRGAFSLALAGLISKILGVVYVVPLQNMIGDYGIGLYQFAYPVYTTMLILSTAGFPLAMSKSVAERVALSDFDGADQIYRAASRLMIITGIVTFLLMYLLSPYLAKWDGNVNATLAMRAIAFALLIVPPLSAMRGFMQGNHHMKASGNSQVVEQFVRVGFIVFGTWWVLHLGYTAKEGAAAATFGGAIGALASLIYLYIHVRRLRRSYEPRMTGQVALDSWTVVKNLSKYALPISLGALVLPISSSVDSFTITNLLHVAGMPIDEATEQFGIFTGRALRLIQLPLSFATAMGLSLMPAITEAITLKNEKLLQERVQISFRLNALITLPAAAILIALPTEINIMLFKDAQGAPVVASVALMSVFAAYELVTTYILQGIGKFYLPVGNMMFGTFCKLLFNIFLVPRFGIIGAAYATVIAYLISSGLNVRAVLKYTKVRLHLGVLLVRPVITSAIMGLALWFTRQGVHSLLVGIIPNERILSTVVLFLVLPVGFAIYMAALLMLGGLERKEVGYIPFFGKYLLRILDRVAVRSTQG